MTEQGPAAMQSIVANAYLQGGAMLLLVALLVMALLATFRYIVKPLWEDNKSLRDKVMEMNERVTRMGEASRITNENTSRALLEQSTAFREMIARFDVRRTT